ncbi:MAG TPA: hypothetical protein VH583_11240 [Vicinamibacterales bacterium]
MRTTIAIVFAVLAGGAGHSQDVQPLSAGEVVKIELLVIATPIDGPSSDVGTADTNLAVGQTDTLNFAVGNTLCERTIGAHAPESASTSWRVGTRLISAEIDRIVLDVAIERRSGTEVYKEIRHVALTEGAPHIVDFVDANESDLRSCRIKNVVLQLSAAVVNSNTSPNQTLTFDLWLATRGSSGSGVAQLQRRIALAGDAAAFRFEPMRRRVATLTTMLREDVFGSVKGRLRPDGRADVSLSVSREFSDGQGGVGDRGGPKLFSAAIDEPVAIELPSPRGVMNVGPSAERVDLAEQFQGQVTEVIVVVHASTK